MLISISGYFKLVASLVFIDINMINETIQMSNPVLNHIIMNEMIIMFYIFPLKQNAHLDKELLRREYEEKKREWEAENTELKNEVAKLNAKMEAIQKQLQDLLDKLLEGEVNRYAQNKNFTNISDIF